MDPGITRRVVPAFPGQSRKANLFASTFAERDIRRFQDSQARGSTCVRQWENTATRAKEEGDRSGRGHRVHGEEQTRLSSIQQDKTTYTLQLHAVDEWFGRIRNRTQRDKLQNDDVGEREGHRSVHYIATKSSSGNRCRAKILLDGVLGTSGNLVTDFLALSPGRRRGVLGPNTVWSTVTTLQSVLYLA